MTDTGNILDPAGTSNDPGVNSGQSIQNDSLDSELDIIFGKEGETQTDDKGKPSDDDLLSDTDGPKDWVKIAKAHQSNRDKIQAEFDKLTSRVKSEYEPAVEFINQLYEDEEVRRAFIGELEPDLIKAKDPQTFIQESLAKEFGSDFEPDDSEVNRLGTKSWLYAKRAEQLLSKAFENNEKGAPQTLKGLREKRLKAKEEAKRNALEQKSSIMNKLKWDENRYNRWLDWAAKITPEYMATYWDRLEKKVSRQQMAAPNLAGIPGGSPVVPNQFKQELDAMFGPN